ncbi:hypothetical protein H0W26_05080 [Candidatus Dependentiae bacterium]|nr:hypothetical protein [Candidatus Dependentiae bacterium]
MKIQRRKSFYELCFVLVSVVGILLPARLSLGQEIAPSTSNVNRKFQAKQLQEDFLIFRKVLEEDHPGLYRYTDKKVLDADFDNTFKRLNREMTEREFFPIVASIVSAIKCGHTGSNPSSELMSYLKTFPLSLRFIKGKAYILSSPNNAIAPGSELLSINGKKVPGITRAILAHLPADGDIETRKYWFLSRRFRLYYNLFLEQPDSFDVEYYDAAKRQKTKINLPPLIENEAQAMALPDDGKKPLRLEFLSESNTALLTIKTFGEDSIKKASQDYPKFLEAAFQEIKRKNVQNLIIDLRANGGGHDEFGSRLFSYLTDKEFRYFDYIETSTDRISLAQYTNAGSTRINKMFAEDLMPAVAGRFRLKQSVDDNLQQLQQPQKNHFDGKVWFLTTGRSFSTTADFCAIAHHHRRGPFIGEEVGGGYYGNNSGPSFRLTLPHTEVRVNIPVWKYVNAVSGYAYPRRGVMPDYPVQPTIQDVLNGIDTEMIYTLKLIKSSTK